MYNNLLNSLNLLKHYKYYKILTYVYLYVHGIYIENTELNQVEA